MVTAEARQAEVLGYRELLRPIGAFLDDIQAREVVLAEIRGGFTWTYMMRSSGGPARTEAIAYEDLPRMRDQMRRRKKTAETARSQDAGLLTLPNNVLPMYPSGYEERLRSLGAKLDSQHAEQIEIVELGSTLLVRFVQPPPAFVRRVQQPEGQVPRFREDSYDAAEMSELIAMARSRRGSKYYY
jgi:hypothetical protein